MRAQAASLAINGENWRLACRDQQKKAPPTKADSASPISWRRKQPASSPSAALAASWRVSQKKKRAKKLPPLQRASQQQATSETANPPKAAAIETVTPPPPAAASGATTTNDSVGAAATTAAPFAKRCRPRRRFTGGPGPLKKLSINLLKTYKFINEVYYNRKRKRQEQQHDKDVRDGKSFTYNVHKGEILGGDDDGKGGTSNMYSPS